MAPTYRVYLLSDPRDGGSRYIGCTRQRLASRLAQHLSHARTGHRDKKCEWLRELLAVSLFPIVTVLQETDFERSASTESYWILKYRLGGAPLTNQTEGGPGSPGYDPPTESRARMGEAARRNHTGVRRSEESRARMVAAQRAIPEEVRARVKLARSVRELSDESRERIAAGQRGKKLAPEVRARLAEKNRNPSQATREKLAVAVLNRPAEQRQAFAQSNKGRRFTEEHRRKMSEAAKARWARVHAAKEASAPWPT